MFLAFEILEVLKIMLDVDFSRMHDNLDWEIETVEEILVACRDDVLLLHRFQGKIHAVDHDNLHETAAFKDDGVVADFLNRDQILGVCEVGDSHFSIIIQAKSSPGNGYYR